MHNILKTMESLGMVDRGLDGKYRIGQALIRLTEPGIKQNALFAIANQIARQLLAQIDETVVIAALYNTDRYLIAHAETTQSLKVAIDIHERRSPFTAPTGRVLLAYLDQPGLARVVEVWGMPGKDWGQIQDLSSLNEALTTIRHKEMESDDTENGQVRRLAVPVWGPDGLVWAAIGVQLPAARLNPEKEVILITQMKNSARLMSEALCVSFGKIDFRQNK
jgi:DNA-binding IclR family transcriptional regulator